jgi:hypothetical protein
VDWWVALGQTISEAGGWAAFLGLVCLIGVGLWRRWWVPGFLFVELEAEVKLLRKSIVSLTGQLARERRRRRTDA